MAQKQLDVTCHMPRKGTKWTNHSNFINILKLPLKPSSPQPIDEPPVIPIPRVDEVSQAAVSSVPCTLLWLRPGEHLWVHLERSHVIPSCLDTQHTTHNTNTNINIDKLLLESIPFKLGLSSAVPSDHS